MLCEHSVLESGGCDVSCVHSVLQSGGCDVLCGHNILQSGGCDVLCVHSVLQSGGCDVLWGHNILESGDVMFIILHTNITTRIFELLLLIWCIMFVEKRKSICLIFEDKLKRRSYGYCTHCWKPNVYIIKTRFWS